MKVLYTIGGMALLAVGAVALLGLVLASGDTGSAQQQCYQTTLAEDTAVDDNYICLADSTGFTAVGVEICIDSNADTDCDDGTEELVTGQGEPMATPVCPQGDQINVSPDIAQVHILGGLVHTMPHEPCVTPTPTPTPEETETPTPTPTPTPEATETPTPTPTPTPEATETPTPEATETPTPEATETPTPEATETPTPTATPPPPVSTPEATETPTATATPAATVVAPPPTGMGQSGDGGSMGTAALLALGGLAALVGAAALTWRFRARKA
jgi:hypothetical protein